MGKRANRPSLSKKYPKRSRLLPEQSVFEANTESLPYSPTMDIQTEREELNDPTHDASFDFDVQDFLKKWKEEGEAFKEKAIPVYAKIYAISDVMATLQKELKDSRIDPTADLLSPTILDSYQIIVDQRIALLIADFLYETNDQRDKMVSALLNPVSNRTFKKTNPTDELRKLIQTMADGVPLEKNPFGNDHPVGMVVRQPKK